MSRTDHDYIELFGKVHCSESERLEGALNYFNNLRLQQPPGDALAWFSVVKLIACLSQFRWVRAGKRARRLNSSTR